MANYIIEEFLYTYESEIEEASSARAAVSHGIDEGEIFDDGDRDRDGYGVGKMVEVINPYTQAVIIRREAVENEEV